MRKIAGLFAVGCLAAASPAFATNGMRMIGFGAVQNSMGGVGVAAPLDAATIITNPAGLSSLQRRVDLSGTFFDPTVKYDAAQCGPSGCATSGQAMKSDRNPNYIPTLGLAWPSNDKITLGLAAFGVAGMGVDYKTDLYGSTTLTSYMNMRIAPAMSYRLSKEFAVGVAANIMYAQMKYAVAGAMGMAPRDTTGSFGYGATIGASYTPADVVTVGIAYETKSFFQDFEWSMPAYDQNGNVVGTAKEKLEFNQPQMVTAGVAVRPIPALLVGTDVEWINWSDTNGKDKPAFKSDPNQTGAMPWNLNWSDQVVLKIGAEYSATPALKLRAGYNYGKMPLDKDRAFENVAFPAIAEHHITGGVGYAFGALTVNVAAVYVPEAKLSGSNMQQGIAEYTTKMSQLAFDIGATYRF